MKQSPMRKSVIKEEVRKPTLKQIKSELLPEIYEVLDKFADKYGAHIYRTSLENEIKYQIGLHIEEYF